MLIGTILVVIIIGSILQIMIILMKTPMVKLLVIKFFFENIVKEIEKIVKITWIHNMREIIFSPNKWKNIFLF